MNAKSIIAICLMLFIIGGLAFMFIRNRHK